MYLLRGNYQLCYRLTAPQLSAAAVVLFPQVPQHDAQMRATNSFLSKRSVPPSQRDVLDSRNQQNRVAIRMSIPEFSAIRTRAYQVI